MMTYNFTFTTRDEYLAYRTDWRSKYLVLTFEIRNNKVSQKIRRDSDHIDNSKLQTQLHQLRVHANQMMLERTAATIFKNIQLTLSSPSIAITA